MMNLTEKQNFIVTTFTVFHVLGSHGVLFLLQDFFSRTPLSITQGL